MLNAKSRIIIQCAHFFPVFVQTNIASYISKHFFLNFYLFFIHRMYIRHHWAHSVSLCVCEQVGFLWRDLKGKWKPNKNSTKLKLLHLINISIKHLNPAYQTWIYKPYLKSCCHYSNILLLLYVYKKRFFSKTIFFLSHGDLLFFVFFWLLHSIHAWNASTRMK